MVLQGVAEHFINDCIEIYDQPVQHSKLEDGFLLSQCLSIKPSMMSCSDSEEYATSKLDVLSQGVKVLSN